MKEDITLKGSLVTIKPYDPSHFDELNLLAKDSRIWTHYAINGGDTDKLSASLIAALEERKTGKQYAFVILRNEDEKIIGSTRYLDIQLNQKKLEIGWTWLHPDYWGTLINYECKLLLLTYAFETLGVYRVQLKTNEHNLRSRKAIQKIGAKFEGILRNDMIQDNGTKRSSAYFSIIDTEWEEVKRNLRQKLQ